MPFYPALPSYVPPKEIHPFTAFVGGLGAAQDITRSGIQNQAMRENLQQAQQLRQARQAYAQGDEQKLLAASPEAWAAQKGNEQKIAAGALQEFLTLAPHATPETWPAFRQDFSRRYGKFPGIINLLPETVKSQEQINKLVTAGGDIANKLQVGRAAALADVDVAARRKTWEQVGKPQQQMEQDFREKLTGINFSNQLNMQENQQRWATAENEKKLKLENDLKNEAVAERREGHLMSNISNEQKELKKSFMKQVEKLQTMYSGPELDAQELKLRRTLDDMQNDILARYKPLADKYDIPFPFEIREKKATTPAAGAGWKGPAMYRGPDGKPVAIRTEDEYNRIFSR